MSTTPQLAKQAFNTAQQELELALQKYQTARTALFNATGQFVGTDARLVNSFNQLSAAAEKAATGEIQAEF